MFSFSYNYFLFFFNYELIILTCFFFFLFFVFIFDQGQIYTSLAELSQESKEKLLKNLSVRKERMRDLELKLENDKIQMKRISALFNKASIDLLHSVQHITKNAGTRFTLQKIVYFNQILMYRTNILSLDIKRFITSTLFIPQNLSTGKNQNIEKGSILQIVK